MAVGHHKVQATWPTGETKGPHRWPYVRGCEEGCERKIRWGLRKLGDKVVKLVNFILAIGSWLYVRMANTG